MNGKIRLFVAMVCIIFGLSVLANSALARPSEPLTYDYAEFRYDPYLPGYKTITIYFRHDSYCNLYIRLYRFDSQVKSWTIDRYTRSGYRSYTTTSSGRWRLQCYMSGYLPYWTDETRDIFGISDPYPSQNNLATDWARHPQDWDIYKKAIDIIGNTDSSYIAAQRIKSHVRSYFVSYTLPPGDYWFQTDLDMLGDLNTYGHYYGNCRSDAVILTAYARALGIPARMIILDIHGTPETGDDTHFFAEFYVLNGSNYQWIPVDGHPSYDWFGITEANQALNRIYWPYGHVEHVSIGKTITSRTCYTYASYTGENYYTTAP